MFHEIAPDFKEYFNTLRNLAGRLVGNSRGYGLPLFEDEWTIERFSVLALKDELVKRLQPLQ